jgi:hypothetical protein
MISESVPRYISLRDTVRRYGTSKSTLYVHIQHGNIRAIKFGGRTLVDRASADRFFDALPVVKLTPPMRPRVRRANP